MDRAILAWMQLQHAPHANQMLVLLKTNAHVMMDTISMISQQYASPALITADTAAIVHIQIAAQIVMNLRSWNMMVHVHVEMDSS